MDPDDPRLMKRADKAAGETGTHTLYTEGVDSDGDGFLNEDGPGGVDLNRNFQHEHIPTTRPDAGPHMVSEPESRALMDFAVDNGHIGAVLTFGHSDNLVTAPDSRRPGLAEPSTASTWWLSRQRSQRRRLSVTACSAAAAEGGRGFGGRRGFGGGGAWVRAERVCEAPSPGSDNDPQSGRRPSVTVDRRRSRVFLGGFRRLRGHHRNHGM